MRPMVLSALLVVVLAEAIARVLAPRLPEPLVWGSYQAQLKVGQMNALAGRGGVDVVAVGSSTTLLGFNPAAAAQVAGDVSFYNAALNGSLPRQSAPWALGVVVPRVHPRVIILGIDSFSLAAGPRSRAEFFTAFQRSPEGERVLDEDGVLDKTDWWVRQHVALWGHRFDLRDPTKLWRAVRGRDSALPADAALIDPNGWSLAGRGGIFVDSLHVDVMGWSYGSIDEAAIVDLIRGARKQDITVVVVDLPVTQNYIAGHPDGEFDYRRYVDRISGVVSRAGGEFIQLGTVRDQGFFADQLHMNSRGSYYFTRTLVARLRADHIL